MAIKETNALLRTKDSNNDDVLVYPVTRAENVEGLDEEFQTSSFQLLQKVYPVGSIYVSTINTNPNILFGFGEWEQIKDVFLLSAGDTYAAGATGGESVHTLTIDEMPSHRHNINKQVDNESGKEFYGSTDSGSAHIFYSTDNLDTTLSTGSSQPHNNMPPYLTVYMFERIA